MPRKIYMILLAFTNISEYSTLNIGIKDTIFETTQTRHCDSIFREESSVFPVGLIVLKF